MGGGWVRGLERLLDHPGNTGAARDPSVARRLLRRVAGCRRCLVAGADRRRLRERRRPRPPTGLRARLLRWLRQRPRREQHRSRQQRATPTTRRDRPSLVARTAPQDASHFYETVCPTVAHAVERYPGRTQIRGSGATFSIVEGTPPRTSTSPSKPPTRKTVDAFHQAGIEAGYPSNGAPGERPEYHPGYYGAFLTDPDSHNIEAVFHDPEPA